MRHGPGHGMAAMREHMRQMRGMHFDMLWPARKLQRAIVYCLMPG